MNFFKLSFLKEKMRMVIRNFVIRILSDDTTEKTTSNTEHLDDINTEVFDWVSNRIETLKKTKNFEDMDNSTALEEEFSEWITANKEDSEIDCMYWEFRGLDKTENL